ncbi:putative reverse transcriptase [Purpureocillium lavendulum]|uniref:Reverse transcriptase n=1 Tax=Purpureocillium lavendulum TaxID=1247861 RepID=A0AB34FFZ3_9HYPO|nr:putative reverse transcriptase [Purpureocillium lavendulum]
MQQHAQDAKTTLHSRRSSPNLNVAAPDDGDWQLIDRHNGLVSSDDWVMPERSSRLRRRQTSSTPITPVDRTAPSLTAAILPHGVARSQPDGSAGLPPWDRVVDIAYHKYRHEDQRRPGLRLPKVEFQRYLERFWVDHAGKTTEINRPKQASSLFTRLPTDVRFRIWTYLVRSVRHGSEEVMQDLSDKPITLNHSNFNGNLWDASAMTHLATVLQPLKSSLLSSFSLYAEVLITVLTTGTFHAVLSPFVGPRLNPLATIWLNKYGVYMRSIILEVDMSRLGLGLSGPEIGPCLNNLGELLHDFGAAQMQRDESNPLESLVLMCRRFYGERLGHAKPAAIQGDGGLDAAGGNARERPTGQSSRESSKNPSPTREEHSAGSSSRLATVSDDPARQPHPDGTVTAIDWHVVNATRQASLKKKASQATITTTRPVATRANTGTGGKATTNPSAAPDARNTQQAQNEPAVDSSYCPDAYLSVCNHLARLRGRLDSLRLVGFGDKYSHQLLATIFPGIREVRIHEHSYRVAPSTAWPLLPGQAAYLDAGQGRGIVLVSKGGGAGPLPLRVKGLPQGPVMPPPPVIVRAVPPPVYPARIESLGQRVRAPTPGPSRRRAMRPAPPVDAMPGRDSHPHLDLRPSSSATGNDAPSDDLATPRPKGKKLKHDEVKKEKSRDKEPQHKSAKDKSSKGTKCTPRPASPTSTTTTTKSVKSEHVIIASPIRRGRHGHPHVAAAASSPKQEPQLDIKSLSLSPRSSLSRKLSRRGSITKSISGSVRSARSVLSSSSLGAKTASESPQGKDKKKRAKEQGAADGNSKIPMNMVFQ